MTKEGDKAQIEKMTPNEERAYWDARDPLRQSKKARVQHPEPPGGRLSYFALRLDGKDITRLAEVAKKRGMRPSELARLFIVRGLELEGGEGALGEQITALKKEVDRIERRLSEAVLGYNVLKEERPMARHKWPQEFGDSKHCPQCTAQGQMKLYACKQHGYVYRKWYEGCRKAMTQ